MDLKMLTTKELYAFLKMKKPQAAVGQTRAARLDLEVRLVEALGGPEGVAKELQPKFNKDAEVIKMVKKAMKRAKRQEDAKVIDMPRPNLFGIELSATQKAQLSEAIESIDFAGKVLKKSGVSVKQVASLLYLMTGIDIETVEKLLTAFVDIKANLVKQDAA